MRQNNFVSGREGWHRVVLAFTILALPFLIGGCQTITCDVGTIQIFSFLPQSECDACHAYGLSCIPAEEELRARGELNEAAALAAASSSPPSAQSVQRPIITPETRVAELERAIGFVRRFCGDNAPAIGPAQASIDSIQTADQAKKTADAAVQQSSPADLAAAQQAADQAQDALNRALDTSSNVLVAALTAAQECERKTAASNLNNRNQPPHWFNQPNWSQTHWDISSP